MKALVLLCCLALAGCLTSHERDPIITTKTVEVPVEVKCVISYPQKPSPRLESVPVTASGYVKAQAALQELEDQRQYAKELHAVLSKCAEDKKNP